MKIVCTNSIQSGWNGYNPINNYSNCSRDTKMATHEKKKIIIAGGSGLIGSYLAKALVDRHYEVVVLTRSASTENFHSDKIRIAQWDGQHLDNWTDQINSAYAVVNLAGASIAGENLLSILFNRWTKRRKELILQSRVSSGKILAEAIEKAAKKPEVFIQASGVGYYGSKSSSQLVEDAPPGSDFLASVSRDWETSSVRVISMGVRHVIVRSGVVLSTSGGILPMVALPIRLFLGGRLGNGNQHFPWIHINDEVNAIQFLMENNASSGPYNLVSPTLVRNAEFGQKLAQVLHRPFYFPIPAFLLKFVLGEKSVLIIEGQQVIPDKLIKQGFKFNFPETLSALKDLYPGL
jgi:uncharacterized protein (TIGR01777 family)